MCVRVCVCVDGSFGGKDQFIKKFLLSPWCFCACGCGGVFVVRVLSREGVKLTVVVVMALVITEVSILYVLG